MLLDVEMPEVDGYEVLAEMKADTRLRDVPVIMTSALDELDSVVRCIDMGADDYLTKPVNPVLLTARVRASLAKKRLHDERRELISKFATREVAEDLLTSGFSLGGKSVEATAMFCDIRSFTIIVEAQGPTETIELLNDYYTLMMDAIGVEGGIVNQMVGDGLMAIFGAPMPALDFRLRAVRAARAMIELIELFNHDQAALRGPQIKIGVGIASGAGDRRLHGHATPRDLHVRRRHREPRGAARVADEGAGPPDTDRREHPERAERRDRGPARGRDPPEGEEHARQGLLRRMSEPRDAAKVQDALYRIAELAGAAQDMQEFYAAVHAIVGELMYADNFFIALYDEERQLDQLAVLPRRDGLRAARPEQVGRAWAPASARGVTA